MEISEQNEFFLSKYELVGTPLKDDSKSFVTRVESQMDNTKSGILKIYKNRDISGIYKQLKALTYPYWPAIYDVRYFEPDTYVVEEELSGCTLRDALESRSKSYTVAQVVDFATSICESLKFLHNLNPPIIHRDIKPENIFLSGNDIKTPMLIDFDAAREYDSDTDRDTVFIATRGYAPPEQYGMMQTDNRSDIYALGVVMHEMLTGELLNKLKITEKMKKKNSFLADVIEKCVKPDPDDRYQRVEELLTALSDSEKSSSGEKEDVQKNTRIDEEQISPDEVGKETSSFRTGDRISIGDEKTVLLALRKKYPYVWSGSVRDSAEQIRGTNPIVMGSISPKVEHKNWEELIPKKGQHVIVVDEKGIVLDSDAIIKDVHAEDIIMDLTIDYSDRPKLRDSDSVFMFVESREDIKGSILDDIDRLYSQWVKGLISPLSSKYQKKVQKLKKAGYAQEAFETAKFAETPVALMYDNSLLGNMKEGFVISWDKLFCCYEGRNSAISLRETKSFEVEANDSESKLYVVQMNGNRTLILKCYDKSEAYRIKYVVMRVLYEFTRNKK